MSARPSPLLCESCCKPFDSDDGNQSNRLGQHFPRFLHCGHTFCSRCIFVKVVLKKSKAVINCESCKEDTEVHLKQADRDLPRGEAKVAVVRSLGPNHAVLELARSTPTSPQVSSQCENCLETKPESVWCENCSAVYCSECFIDLHQNRVMARHISRTIEDPIPPHEICLSHKKRLGRFCFEEKILICDECVVDHENHKTAGIEKSAEELRKSMLLAQKKSSDASKALEELSKRFVKRSESVVAEGQELSAALNSRYEHVLQLLGKLRDMELSVLARDMYRLSIDALESNNELLESAQKSEEKATLSKREMDYSPTELLKQSVVSTGDFHKFLASVAAQVKKAKDELSSFDKGFGERLRSVDQVTDLVKSLTTSKEIIGIEDVSKLREYHSQIMFPAQQELIEEKDIDPPSEEEEEEEEDELEAVPIKTHSSEFIPLEQGEPDFIDSIEDTEWIISEQQAMEYEKLFSVADADGDGVVGGPEAVVFFQKSGLPISKLSHIWSLADQFQTGALNMTCFAVAMHLIVIAKKHPDDFPVVLPSTLLDSAEKYFGEEN